MEKQIRSQNGESPTVISKNSDVPSTPPTISKSLYEKVLNRAAAFKNKNNFNGGSQIVLAPVQNSKDTISSNEKPKYTSINSRSKPQSAGIEKLPEFDGLLREKPKYITISRTNTKKPSSEIEYSDENSEESSLEEEEPVTQKIKNSNRLNNFKYTSIQRQRPSIIAKQEVSEEELDEETTEAAPVFKSSPNYISFSRQRPSLSVTTSKSTTTRAPQTQKSTSR